MTGGLAIEVFDLEKRFERGGVQALAGVSFDVDKGEIFGFLGRNGAGKSTAVGILTTLLRPTGGRALVGGFDVSSQPAAVRRVVGAALQDAALDELMSGREHLVLAGRLIGLGRAPSCHRAEELLEVFGLGAAADRIAARYSGGMRRRLDIAMAMVRRPDVLFLDEPTTGLDPQGRRGLWAVVREMRDLGSTVFLTTQNLDEAEELASRVAIVHEGRIAAIGTPAELRDRFGGAATVRLQADAATAARIRDSGVAPQPSESHDGWITVTLDGGATAVPAMLARLGAAGASIGHYSVVTPSLEDVFVNLTGAEIESAVDSGSAAALAAVRRGAMGVIPGSRR